MADDGLQPVGQVVFVHHEVASVEERGHGTAQQHRTYDAIHHQTPLEGLRTKEVAQLVLELIAHGLEHEGEQDDHPKPVGSAERGAVEQGERGEESAAKGDQCGERKLPLAAGGIDYKTSAFCCLSKRKDHGVGALHEHEEHQQGSQH